MGVYIKGMEMPQSCFYCPMREWHIVHGEKITSCRVAVMLIKDEDDKPDWCPLVSVPPHGRLIDADALLASENQHYEYRSDSFYVETRTIELAPTIIPADKDGVS